MADNPFGQIEGFLSSLVDPFSEQAETQTQDADTTIATPTRIPVLTSEPRATTVIETTPSTSAFPSSSTSNKAVASTKASSPSPTIQSTFSTTNSRTTFFTASTSSSSSTAATATTAAQSSSSPPANTGAIAGGVVGGLAVLALLAFSIIWLLRSDRRKIREKAGNSTKAPYEGSVVSLVAYAKDNDSSWLESTRPSTTQEAWDAESIKAMPAARLHSGPAIFVTDEFNNRRDICELPGSEPEMPRSELESGQKYHPYRPQPS